MQQVSGGSGLKGSQAQGPVSSQSTKSIGDPPHSSRAAAARPKKRERTELICDPVKQQRTDKPRSFAEDRDSSCKPEASSLVGKDGGISCVASVDRLVCIMQYEWNDNAERQLDLIASRTMLAKVVAATSNCECLVKFLRLGGLAILDRWLQEAHRGRHFANKEVPVDGEKAVEDLLLALLAALEKLPVDLVILKTCLVGKSVNLLRSHKHPDIQRRSKKLVEAWKKRVESEMKESGRGRLQVDPAFCMQYQEGGMMASKMHLPYYENFVLNDDSGFGRTKFASVASLCSSSEGLLRAPSTLLSCTSLEGIDSVPNKVASNAHVLGNGVLSKSPLRFPSASSPSREDGKSKSSVNVVSTVANEQVSCNQVRGLKGTGAARSRRNSNVSNTKVSSATALSASVITSKDNSASDSREQSGLAAASVATTPCCSSSQQNPQNSSMYDGLTRSSLNSVSSCATDGNKRSLTQSYTTVEPVKAGIAHSATVAASENSTIDAKGPDSPSNISVSMQRAVPIQADNGILPEIKKKCYDQFVLKTGSRPQDGEHCDQISSTVSSPSETSAHVDIRVCESKPILPIYANAFIPYETTSETSLPSSGMRKDANKISGLLASAQLEQEKVQAVSENIKRVCLQPVLPQEAVGESSVVDKTKSMDLKGGVQGRSSLLNHGNDDPLEAARQSAADVQQQVRNSQVGLHVRGTSEKNCSPICYAPLPDRFTDAKLGNSSLKVPSNSDVVDSVKVNVYQRPDFDLNEMISSEEGIFLASSMSANAAVTAVQNSFGPACASRLTNPVAPMTPIAVVAAAKGPFLLPSAYVPKGDLGWKGSAATSAFRPTQPRASLQKFNLNVAEQGMNVRVLRDFDLNIAADPSSQDHGEGLSTSSAAATATFPARQAASVPDTSSSVLFERSSALGGASLDLNQVDGGGEPQGGRQDFDLNSGPMLQDSDNVVLAGKHHGMTAPLISDISNSVAPNKLPSHSPNVATPVMMPAFAMTNSEFPYPVGPPPPWLNAGCHDGLLHYNTVMQNPSGMACPPPLPSMPGGLYGGIPFGFSPASMQNFSGPFMDALGGPRLGQLPSTTCANGEQPRIFSQCKTPYMMGILADATRNEGNGGFWSRSNLDLNAGPDGIDLLDFKEEQTAHACYE